jgi:uncharacterized membrane protein YoaK (UPF0700 family)
MMSRTDERPRHAPLVGLLTFTSGCVDVVTLMAVGGAFTSVITGNLIFIGRAIGTSSLEPALHAIMAVAGYVAGVAAGSRLRQFAEARLPSRAPGPVTPGAVTSGIVASGPRAAWPPSSTLVLAVESAMLVALNVAWIGYGADPPAAATDLMLTAAALALGLQGAAARGIAGNPSTTYMTGALTTLIEALSTGGRRAADLASVTGLIALVVGAACSALLVEHARQVALVLPLVSLLLVIAIKLRDHRAERRAGGRRSRATPRSLNGTVPPHRRRLHPGSCQYWLGYRSGSTSCEVVHRPGHRLRAGEMVR